MNVSMRSALACCALFAALVMVPRADAQAGTRRSVNRAELQATGAGNLYDAVAGTRPAWLFLAGDTADAQARERVLVFVDGRHVGNLNTLRTLNVETVGSVRVRTEQYVRRTIPRFPRQGFSAALFVSSHTLAENVFRERFSVRVRGGLQMMSQARGTSRAYKDEGFDDVPVEATHNYVDQGNETPAFVGAGVHVAVRAPFGVEVEGQHTFDGWTYGMDYARAIFNGTMSSTEGAVLATFSKAPFRIGLGPAYRQTRWTYHGGFHRVGEGEKLTTSGIGGVGSLAITLPGPGRSFGEFSLRAASYAEDSPRFGQVPPVPAGKLVVSGGFGFGVRF